jgi:hypothetical protein
MVIRNLGPNYNRPADQLDRQLRLALVAKNNAQQMKRIGMIRLPRKNLPVNCFRFGDPAGPMVLQRDAQHLGRRGCVIVWARIQRKLEI